MGLDHSSGSKRAGSPVLNPNAMLGHNIKRPRMRNRCIGESSTFLRLPYLRTTDRSSFTGGTSLFGWILTVEYTPVLSSFSHCLLLLPLPLHLRTGSVSYGLLEYRHAKGEKMGSVHKCWHGVWTAIVVHPEMGDQGYMKRDLTKGLLMSCKRT